MPILFFLLLSFFVAPLAAQESNAEAISEDGTQQTSLPDVYVPSLDDTPSSLLNRDLWEERRAADPMPLDEGQSEPRESAEIDEDSESSYVQDFMDVPVIREGVRSHHQIGIGLNYSNHALSKGIYKISDDSILLGEAAEKSFGLFVLLDLGWRQDSSEALRIRWGIVRSLLTIPDSIRSAYPADSLEEQLNLMSFDLTLKQVVPSWGSRGQSVWWGGGIALRHAFSSQTSGSGLNQQSQLRHSSSLAPLLSLGMDMREGNAHTLGLQVDWILWRGFQASIGISTYL